MFNLDMTGGQTTVDQTPQNFSQDILLQELLAQTSMVCDTHLKSVRDIIKGDGLKTWVLPDGGQSLEHAQHSKQLCIVQPHPCWRP